jgi:Zn-finger nucleic acid-binding protein
MPCPVCNVPLVMSERQGVEIDYCQQCRGVWLDRGELDKIIERSARDMAPPPQVPPQTLQAPPPQQGYGHGQSKHGYPKRRKSFLEELFD